MITPDRTQADRFLTLLDESADSFTFQAFDDCQARKDPALARVLNGSLAEHWDRLCDLSRRGAGIFVTINRTDGLGRKAENIKAVRAVWRELDRPGAPELPIDPHVVIESSPGKFHEYLLIDESEDFELAAGIQRRLVADYGSDPSAADLPRVLRLPGFQHQKDPANPWLVKIVHESGMQPYSLEELARTIPPLAIEPPAEQLPAGHGIDNQAEVESALAVLNADMDYNDWLKVGMSLHHAADGCAKGLRLWDDWSQQGALYRQGECEYRYRSFGRRNGKQVTIKSLFKMAHEAGWRWSESASPPEQELPPVSAYEDDIGGPDFDFLMTDKDRPRAIVHNVLEVLRKDPAWKGVLGYDAFAERAVFLKPPPFGNYLGEIEDWHDTGAAAWIQAEHDLCVSSAMVAESIQAVARENSFHPVREYLESCQWDGKPRLDTWLQDFFGAKDNEYTRAVGSKTLIQAVARVLRPGCKADCVLILEGDQGLFKSTAFRILAGDEWFTDSLPDLHSKDAMQSLAGKWIIEFGELSSLRRSETEAVKRFIAATQDHYRPSYGRRSVTLPRQCVFIGSTNSDDYLKDHTGNRRFWPVSVTKRCNILSLKAIRDQLWAEAVVRFRKGERWYLTGSAEALAAEEQDKRREEYAWEGFIMDWLDCKETAMGKPRDRITVDEILDQLIPVKDRKQTHRNEVVKILKAHKWRRICARDGNKRIWTYERPAGTSGTSAEDLGTSLSKSENPHGSRLGTSGTSGTNVYVINKPKL